MRHKIRGMLRLALLSLVMVVPANAQPLGKASPLVVVKQGFSSAVNAVAISADGRQMLSGGHDNVLRMWDVATGQLLRVFDADTESVNAVAFSPMCCQVVAGGDDRRLRFWDMRTGATGLTLAEHSGEVTAVAFSPDGSLVASGSRDQTVMLWDVASGQRRHTLSSHRGAVTAVAFSADGKRLISASADKTLLLWDVDTGQPAREPFAGHTDEVTSAAFSPDGQRAVSGGKDKTLRVWDLGGGASRTLGEHGGEILTVAFSPDGRLVVSAGKDQSLKIWDSVTAQLLRMLTGHTGQVTAVTFLHDGQRLLSAGWDKTLRIWDAGSDQPLSTVDIEATKFAPNGYIYPLRAWLGFLNIPKPGDLAQRLRDKGFKLGSPVFLRLFKGDLQAEVWMMRGTRFELFASYPICAFSGQLGPKEAKGDFQAPEGFYTVTKAQLNAHSRYHRAFDFGYPNAYDRAHGRTGGNLEIHGDCRSVGCYAMTDPVIDDLWQLVTAAIDAGQERVAMHVFPFRMTDARMAAFAWHPSSAFWQDLKHGHDLFEADRIPPQASVCGKRYVVRHGTVGERSAPAVLTACGRR